MLIAEEFVLLALDPDGRPAHGVSNRSAVAIGVNGALVAELVLDGHVDVADGRIRLTGTRPTNQLLAGMLTSLTAHEGQELESQLGLITYSGWTKVVGAMVAAGVVGSEKFMLRPTRHPVSDEAAHASTLAEIQSAATGDGPMRPRTAILLALAGPSRLLKVVAPARSDRAKARERIAEAAEQVPAAAAVAYVIRLAEAAFGN